MRPKILLFGKDAFGVPQGPDQLRFNEAEDFTLRKVFIRTILNNFPISFNEAEDFTLRKVSRGKLGADPDTQLQ